ncbi:hypothetical protein [Methylobacterium sp. Leaf91]|uniref:hypothetical protein n=1 Tax=Methylobacterium sp. Leaf91 TaxID=1736247 RepID=UPI0007005530|nr:hypothetical protein [Methylobacterium sp. Leaf91]KQO94640.1 hypothetical protein ASF32_19195 [Methylobacterium sp. Leaf91]
MSNTAAPSPPPVNDLWRIPAIAAIVGAIVLWVHLFIPKPAHAETIGYRIEAEACRGAVCRPLTASSRIWGGLYACQGRAANIARFGLPGDPREIRARCTAIAGMPSA